MVELRIWSDGDKTWYLNELCHRDNGPAVDWEHGVEWYWRDQEVTEYEHMMLAGQEQLNG